MKKNVQSYYLDCVYDGRKSFYNKARVEIEGNEERLFSYETLVGRMVNGVVDFVSCEWSVTTNRHIREWLRQHNLDPVEYMK